MPWVVHTIERCDDGTLLDARAGGFVPTHGNSTKEGSGEGLCEVSIKNRKGFDGFKGRFKLRITTEKVGRTRSAVGRACYGDSDHSDGIFVDERYHCALICGPVQAMIGQATGQAIGSAGRCSSVCKEHGTPPALDTIWSSEEHACEGS